ncbi:MAG: ribonuclease III [Eubacterium sp.]|nr:ribonuclease III [Eubacterium sp.]
MNKSNLELFYDHIDYRFSDVSLLENALTHSSYANELKLPYTANNERLEFLGDAVLEIIVSRFLFMENPTMPEGNMTTLRASLVCEPSLAQAARQIELDHVVQLGHGEEKTGGRQRDSILSDAFEALIGAIYLDGGMEEAERFVTRFILTDIESKSLYHDCKSKLQEIVQEFFHENSEIVYEIVEETGPAHAKSFTVVCRIQGKEFAVGTSHTKKKAEQEAAYKTLLMIKDKELPSFLS